MIGEVISYSKEKEYGFIKTEKESIFFHKSSTKGFNPEEGMMVEFEKVPSPKGYKAKNVKVVNTDDMNYEAPSKLIVSKTPKINGYKILNKKSDFDIVGSARDLDAAKNFLRGHAFDIGANGLINYKYERTTESESSDNGSGTHYYTMHHFKAEPVFVGKKSINGFIEEKDIPDLNEILWEKYSKNEKQKNKNFKKKTVLILLFSAIIIYFFNYGFPENIDSLFVKKDNINWMFPSIAAFFIAVFMMRVFIDDSYDDWLSIRIDD